MAEQMVKRSVYPVLKDGQMAIDVEPIRTGLVPKDLKPGPNGSAWMEYWDQEDARKAESEAAEAAKRAAELQAPKEPGAAELVGPLAERLASAEAELEVLRGLKAASPDAVLEGTMQIARAAGAAALVEAAGQTVIKEVDAAAAAADGRLKAIEGQVSAAAEATGQLLADGRQSLEQTQAEMVAKVTSAISKRITKFEVDAAKMRGPKGDRGRVGQGLIAGTGKRPEKRPDGSDWAPGDSWMDTKSEGFTLEYLGADGQWSKPARLVPAPILQNAVVNQLDMAPRVSASFTTAPNSDSEGAAADAIKTFTMSKRANLRLAGLDRYDAAGFNDLADSALVSLEVTALDGPRAGQNGTWVISIAQRKGSLTADQTDYGGLGQLVEDGMLPVIDIVDLGNYTKPVTVAGTFPPSPTKHLVCTGWSEPSGGMTSPPTQVAIRGWVKWNYDSRVVGAKPAWKLSDEL